MTTPTSSPALRPTRDRAPEPSAALLALQQKGLELPLHRNTSTPISPQSNPTYDRGPQVSPLSILSTPSNFRPSPAPPSEPEVIEFAWRRRTSSTASVETTVTGILNLYTNLSKQTLNSEYEEITPYPDSGDESEDNAPPLPMVHQPKAQAYRDTIAPLLEHQFSNSSLMVPGAISLGPSPMSLASMPLLMHPDANLSVPSLRLTPDGSPGRNLGRTAKSDTSIQVTPEMSPIPVLTYDRATTSDSNEKKIVLEVPDVRDADSWYDQPLSPISPEDLEYRNAIRDSQQSAVSPQSPATQTNHFRSLAFESLSPPLMNVKKSPGLRSVKVIDGDKGMIPLPLDLNRSRTLISRGSTPAYQTEIIRGLDNEIGSTRSQHPSMLFTAQDNNDFIDGPLKTPSRPLEQRISYVTAESDSTKHLSIEDIEAIERPCSAFSSSSDSYVIHDTISGQVKAMWKEKFGKKKEKKWRSKEGDGQMERKSVRESKGKEKVEKMRSGPTLTKDVTTAFIDEPDSYRYPYELTRASISEGPGKCVNGSEREIRSTSATYGARSSTTNELYKLAQTDHKPKTPNHTSTNTSIQPVLEHPAIPLTHYQKYGPEYWYESNKKKRRQERERSRKESEKSEKYAREAQATMATAPTVPPKDQKPTMTDPYAQMPPHIPDSSRPEFYQQMNHSHAQAHVQSHNHSHTHTHAHAHNTSTTSTTSSRPSTDLGTNSSTPNGSNQRRSGGGGGGGGGDGSITKPSSSYTTTYNNDLFEASGGGKKRSTPKFASRLMMSSEEKRKRKVKESITILGGERMSTAGSGEREEVW